MEDAIKLSLRQHYLFSAMQDEQFDQLMSRIRILKLQAGEILFNQSEAAEKFYCVLNGQIKLYKVSASGQEKVMEIMPTGYAFAHAIMFMERNTYPVTSQALVDSVVAAIPSQPYRAILEKSAESCIRMLGDLSMRLHHKLQEHDQLAQQNASYRFVRYLLSILPDDAKDVVEIDLPIPKNVLASKLTIKPESFSRLLASLSQKNIISVDKNHIKIHDLQKLRDL